MIFKQINDIVKNMAAIMANDEVIKKLLFYSENAAAALPSSEQLLRDGYITTYPVVLTGEEKHTFIAVHLDNTILTNDNSYISTFKITVGTYKDTWLDDQGDARILLMVDEIEKIISGQRICDNTSPIELLNVQAVYWDSLTIGYSLIFQCSEEGEINESII